VTAIHIHFVEFHFDASVNGTLKFNLSCIITFDIVGCNAAGRGKGPWPHPQNYPFCLPCFFCLRIYQNAISQFKKSKFCIALDFSAFVPRPVPNFRMGCISFVYNKTVYILCRFYLFFTIASRYIQYRYIIHVMSSAVAAASVSSIKFLYSLFRHHLM